MSEGKVKLYKNPKRSEPEQPRSYTPQYQVMGIEPEVYKSAMIPSNQPSVIKPPQTTDNPRNRKPTTRQPYGEVISSPIGVGKGPIPNVGNNMEHTWSNVDGDIDDDLALDGNHPMIDNNEVVSAQSLGISEQIHQPVVNNTYLQQQIDIQPEITATSNNNDIISVLQNIAEGDYLLLIDGVAVCSGPLNEIQEQARLLVFGEHDMCDGEAIPIENIIIVKRVLIKVGLFLE